MFSSTVASAGNIHGMPVSFLLGLGSKVPEFAWLKPVLKAERLVYIGLRDVDAGEKRILRDNNIKVFSMHEVDKYGIGKVLEMALDHVNPNRDLPIHLSVDVDALDPSVAPSTGTPVRKFYLSQPPAYSYLIYLGSWRTDFQRRALHL
jgi:arginase